MYKVSAKSERVTWGTLVELTWNDPILDNENFKKIKNNLVKT